MNVNLALKFAKTLSGQYSNKDQAIENPRFYANINIYFRPIPWSVLEAPGFYSEHSYDIDPWSPYKQALHRLLVNNNTYILENYHLNNKERFAGSGFTPSLLEELDSRQIKLKKGCSMHFNEISDGSYVGNIEPGRKCLVTRDGKTSYLESKVTLTKDRLITLDKGLDRKTKEQLWGSLTGSFVFKRIEYLGSHLDENWLTLKR